MLLKNTRENFGVVSKSFHWAVAIIVLLLLSVGFWMTGLAFSPFKLSIYMLHKSFGITVLILMTGRVGWRLYSPRPEALPTHKPWEDKLAKAVHFALYICLFIMPLDGWVMSSAGGFPATFFGLFPLPSLVDKNKEIFELTLTIHTFTAYAILVLLALHFAGAFKHHFIDRDMTLKRMTSNKVGLGLGIVLALLALFFWIKPVSLAFMGEEEKPAPAQTYQAGQPDMLGNVQTAPPPGREGGVPATRNDGSWAIDLDNSSIDFEATQYGETFSGKFSAFGGKIIFDPKKLDDAYADIWIDISSITTGSDDRDTQAKSSAWFDTANFPKAMFVADSFSETSPNHYVAHGALTIHGKAALVDLPFTLQIRESPRGQAALMEGEVSLNRLDFGVGSGEWTKTDTIGNEVKLKIRVLATDE